jgi:hypothetical protein
MGGACSKHGAYTKWIPILFRKPVGKSPLRNVGVGENNIKMGVRNNVLRCGLDSSGAG